MEAKEEEAVLAGDDSLHLVNKQAAENAHLLQKIKTLELAAAQSSGNVDNVPKNRNSKAKKSPELLSSLDPGNAHNKNDGLLNKTGRKTKKRKKKKASEVEEKSSPEIGSIGSAPPEAGSRDRLAADMKILLETQKAQVEIQKKAQLEMQKAQLEMQQMQLEILQRTEISKKGTELREARRLDGDINGGKSGVCTIS
jgi:hypothetical protein